MTPAVTSPGAILCSVCQVLTWDVSRTRARGGVTLTWHDKTGWSNNKLQPQNPAMASSKPRHPAPQRLRQPGRRRRRGPEDLWRMPNASRAGSRTGRIGCGRQSRARRHAGRLLIHLRVRHVVPTFDDLVTLQRTADEAHAQVQLLQAE